MIGWSKCYNGTEPKDHYANDCSCKDEDGCRHAPKNHQRRCPTPGPCSSDWWGKCPRCIPLDKQTIL